MGWLVVWAAAAWAGIVPDGIGFLDDGCPVVARLDGTALLSPRSAGCGGPFEVWAEVPEADRWSVRGLVVEAGAARLLRRSVDEPARWQTLTVTPGGATVGEAWIAEAQREGWPVCGASACLVGGRLVDERGPSDLVPGRGEATALVGLTAWQGGWVVADATAGRLWTVTGPAWAPAMAVPGTPQGVEVAPDGGLWLLTTDASQRVRVWRWSGRKWVGKGRFAAFAGRPTP